MSCKIKKIINIKITTLILMIISCSEDKIEFVSNDITDLPDENYSLNLRSNSGEKLDTVIITWNDIEGDILLNNLSTGDIFNSSDNNYIYENLTPSDYFNIEVSGEKNGINYIDTIQIYTRSIYPVTNFQYEVQEVMRGDSIYNEGELFTDLNGNSIWDTGESHVDELSEKYYHRLLTWSITKEIEEDFIGYKIFRSQNPSELINVENCDCIMLFESNILTDSSYTDSSSESINSSGAAAFYYMVEVSGKNYTRNSFIYNFTGFNEIEKIILEDENISTNSANYISIEWEIISDPTYFYQYEIYRSPNNNMDSYYLIAEIPNYLVDYFQDRNVGSGATWYYSIAVVDINGRKSFSDSIAGWVLP